MAGFDPEKPTWNPFFWLSPRIWVKNSTPVNMKKQKFIAVIAITAYEPVKPNVSSPKPSLLPVLHAILHPSPCCPSTSPEVVVEIPPTQGILKVPDLPRYL